MKRHGLMCLLIVCCMMVLLVACNRGDTATSNTNGGKSDSGGSASSRTSGEQTVDVHLNEYTIISYIKDFKAGQAYHFVVHNIGKTTHEFMIMPRPTGNMGGMGMDSMDKQALLASGDIAAGQTKTLNYTFTASAAHSHPQFACYVGDHYMRGMKLDVAVS